MSEGGRWLVDSIALRDWRRAVAVGRQLIPEQGWGREVMLAGPHRFWRFLFRSGVEFTRSEFSKVMRIAPLHIAPSTISLCVLPEFAMDLSTTSFIRFIADKCLRDVFGRRKYFAEPSSPRSSPAESRSIILP